MYYRHSTIEQKDSTLQKERKRCMAWNLDSDRPIYLQLVERLQLQIVSGQYPKGAKLPSVRELAAEAAVNPNTLQKAFAELERSGLVNTQRTSGRNVTEDEALIEELRRKLAKESAGEYRDRMQKLGYAGEDAIEFLRQSMQ